MASGLDIGSTLAGYRIEGIVARGGMGVVYEATQLALDRKVALKVIAPEIVQDASFRERFQRESRLAASIDHPNVIPVHEAGDADGLLYITMRLVDGIDLGRMVGRLGPLAPDRAVQIVGQVAAALDAAHGRGLIHRDVKPANVLVAMSDHVYLTDFGLVKDIGSDSGMTDTGQMLGTINYSPPEQIAGGSVDARADIYSLGCVAYQVLTGALPFARDTPVAAMWAHTNDPPPDISQVRPELAMVGDVLKRALAKSPDERFPSAGDFARALEAAVSGTSAAPERSVAVGQAASGTTPRPYTGDTEAGSLGPSAPTAPPATAHMPTAATEAGGESALDTPTAHRAPAPAGGGRPRWLVPLLLGLAAVTVAAVALLLLGGADDGAEPGDALTARTLSVTPTRVGGTPQGIAVGEGGVWFADNAAGTVRKLDPESGEPQGDPIRVGASPTSVAIGEGFVWVVSSGDSQLTRVDPGTGEVTGQPVTIPFGAGEIETGDGGVWVTDPVDDRVLRVDPRKNRVVEEIDVPAGVGGDIAVGSGYVWVTGKSFEPALTIIETATNRVVPGEANFNGDVAAGEGFGWAYDPESFVSRIDPATKEERGRATIEGGSGGELEIGAGVVWALDETNGRLWRIDPRTARLTGSATPVQAETDSSLAVGAGAVWVTQPGSDTVVRIGF